MWLPDPGVRESPATNPLRTDLSALPPAVIMTAEHDPLRDEVNAYAARLRDAGVPLREMAVLFRINAQSEAFEEALTARTREFTQIRASAVRPDEKES